MLGQYGLGASGSGYGQHRAPMGFGGGGLYGSQLGYGAYTPRQGLGQSSQSNPYSAYTPQAQFNSGPTGLGFRAQPQNPQQTLAQRTSDLGLGSAYAPQQQMGILPEGQYYTNTNENFVAPTNGFGGGNNISRQDAGRLNNASNVFSVSQQQMPMNLGDMVRAGLPSSNPFAAGGRYLV